MTAAMVLMDFRVHSAFNDKLTENYNLIGYYVAKDMCIFLCYQTLCYFCIAVVC